MQHWWLQHQELWTDHLSSIRRSPELKSILDWDTAFPSSPYDSEPVLASLQQVGLQTSASFQTLLESARYTEHLATQDEAAAVQR